MSNKIILTVLAGAAISCLPALAKKPVSTQSDASFLAMAAQADMTTAHLGQDAADRGATEKVKDLGATLARDHTSDYNTLAELASKTGETIPKSIDARNDREIDAIDRYKGKRFDHAFLLHESEEHEKLVRAFREEAEHGTNPDIKGYATKALPTIERHLHDIRDLLKSQA
jgi:putative membrane protein